MSAPDFTRVQLNFKSPSGALINLYAENIAEAKEMAEAFIEDLAPVIGSLEQSVNAVSNLAAAGITGTPAPTPTPAGQDHVNGTPIAAPAPPAEAQHMCKHGEPMKLIPAGISKATGRPYKAFFTCPRPRNEQCDAKVWG